MMNSEGYANELGIRKEEECCKHLWCIFPAEQLSSNGGVMTGDYHHNHKHPYIDGKDKLQPGFNIHV